jgi:hypothetical protein
MTNNYPPGTAIVVTSSGKRRLIVSLAAANELESLTPSKKFYHGTRSESAALKILSSGTIIPGSQSTGRGMMSPVGGRVYVTQSLETAIIYALGGDVAGHEMPDSFIGTHGRYGYIFEVVSDDNDNLQPDEDSIGELIYKKKAPQWLVSMFVYNVAESRRRKLMNGEWAYFASVGKQLLRLMSDEYKKSLLTLVPNAAHKGDMKISKAWRIDKTQTKKIARDGSNFHEVAEEIPVQKNTNSYTYVKKMIVANDGINATIVPNESFGYHDEDDGFYYHVTSVENAHSIISSGKFIPGGSSGMFSAGAPRTNSKGKVFFTNRSGVRIWIDRISEQLEHSIDLDEDDKAEDFVAVVRIPKNVALDAEPDKMGETPGDVFVGRSVSTKQSNANNLSKRKIVKTKYGARRLIVSQDELQDDELDDTIIIYRGVNPERNQIANNDPTHGRWFTTTYEDAISYANWDYEGCGELGPGRAILALEIPLSDAFEYAQAGSRRTVDDPEELLDENRPIELLLPFDVATRAKLYEGDPIQGELGRAGGGAAKL